MGLGRSHDFVWEQKLQQSQHYANAAMALLEGKGVPPFPDFYRLIYDYLAGLQQVNSWRLEAVLNAESEAPVRERLYEEFVRPYEAAEVAERANSLIHERMAVLAGLIEGAGARNREHTASLEAATATLAASSTRASLLKDWIKRVEAVNQRAMETNRRLLEDLDATAAAFDDVCREIARHRRDSLMDPLTGLVNRLGFDTSLSNALTDARENGGRFALAIIDIDNFKDLNDSYGHQAGDSVLRFVARALLANSRSTDIVGRFGGDEFLAIIGDVDERQAEQAAEKLCKAIRQIDLRECIAKDILGNITCSVGIACFRADDGVASMLGRADKCLYEAKHTGRNRWVSSAPLTARSAARSG